MVSDPIDLQVDIDEARVEVRGNPALDAGHPSAHCQRAGDEIPRVARLDVRWPVTAMEAL
jgi:hypothetical protein